MKRRVTARFGLVCVVLLLIAACPISMLINNVALDRFARQLGGVQAAGGAKLLERKAALGKLSGNGNGLDFLACLLIHADMTPDELRAALTLPDFRAAKWGVSNGINVELLPTETAWTLSEPLRRANIAFESLEGAKDLGGYYLLILYDSGYSAALEPRGH